MSPLFVGPLQKSAALSANLLLQAMYGAMIAFAGCSAFNEAVVNNPIERWFSDMRRAVQNHDGRAMIAERTKNLPIQAN